MEFLFICFLLLIILSFVWPPDSPWSPWWRTNKKVARAACRLAGVSSKDTIYELGSGDGEFILIAAKEFGAKKALGIEIDHSRYFISRIRKLISRTDNAVFIRADFKKVDLKKADLVYFYLVPRVIERIMPKLKRELKKGTKVLSYRYKLPIQEKKKKGEIYYYEF